MKEISSSSRRDFFQLTAMIILGQSTVMVQNAKAYVSSQGGLYQEDKKPREEKPKQAPFKTTNNFPFDPRYFVAGGGCAAFSHGIATPFDVVKTKIQADQERYNFGFLNATISLVQLNGLEVLLTGLAPTLIGYGIEGAVKFGVYESLKPVFLSLFHTNENTVPYLAASVGAGAIASLLLVPMERYRIEMVTGNGGDDDEPCTDCIRTGQRIQASIQEEGLSSIFYGYNTMLMKQIPYTMAKQVSFDIFASYLFSLTTPIHLPSEQARFITTTVSAFLASILACIFSQPGDVLLTSLYKNDKHACDTPFMNAINIYNTAGLSGLFTGFSARLVHVMSIVTSQLLVYDTLKQWLGLPATASNC